MLYEVKHLKILLPAAQNDNDRRLRDLISYSENPNPFDEKETQALIAAIDTGKILDPACGSGAFLWVFYTSWCIYCTSLIHETNCGNKDR